MAGNERVQEYAKAFFDAAWERWFAALGGAAERLEQDPALAQRLSSGEGDPAQRQRTLDGLLPPGSDASVRGVLYTLMQRGDLALLPDVVAALRQQVAAAGSGPVDVEVVSAVELTEQEAQALRARLESRFGANLVVHYRVDPAILGGMIVRAGDKLIDGSLATRLNEMKQALGVTARG